MQLQGGRCAGCIPAIGKVQSDIEVLKGQIKYIDQSAALSSVNVTLVAEAGTQPIEIGGWKLQGTAKEAAQDLIRFTQGFTRFLIRFVILTLPALILIAIPLYLIFIGGRAVYRRVPQVEGYCGNERGR